MGRTFSGVTTPDQSWPGSNGNEGVLQIPQSSSITEASPSDCIISRTLVRRILPLTIDAVGVFSRRGHSLEESCPSVENLLVYSAASANWTTRWGSLTPLQSCCWCFLQPQPTGPPGHSLGESYPFAEKWSVYSTVSGDWVTRWGSFTPLQRCCEYVLPRQPTGPCFSNVWHMELESEMCRVELLDNFVEVIYRFLLSGMHSPKGHSN